MRSVETLFYYFVSSRLCKTNSLLKRLTRRFSPTQSSYCLDRHSIKFFELFIYLIKLPKEFAMQAKQPTRCESEMDSDDLIMIETMLCKEQTTYAQHDYFARSLPVAPDTTSDGTINMPVDQFCRNIMAKWCFSLCTFCSYDRRMVSSVMSCVDRYVSTPKGSRILLSRDQYQLAVMSSLYLVAKVQQTQALEPGSIAKLSRGKYSKADIENMEIEILSTLKWFVNPQTPTHFAHEFLQKFDFVPEGEDDDDSIGNFDDQKWISSSTSAKQNRLVELVNCQIEEATCDYELSCLTRPSHVAFVAMSNALQSLDIDPSSLDSMRVLKERLQIVDEHYVSSALLRVISTSETSDNTLSNHLLDRCNKNVSSSSLTHAEQKSSLSFSGTASSVPSSPRTVADGIIC